MGSAAEKIDDKALLQTESNENPVEMEENEESVEIGSGPESILKNYIRLMTWEELIEIASVFDATLMTPLTDYLTKEVLDKRKERDQQIDTDKTEEKSDSKAKILPFTKNVEMVESSSKEDDYNFDKYDREIENSNTKSVIEVNKNGSFSIFDQQEEIRKKKNELKKINLGEFILRQKNKLKQCQKKLKKKEIYLLYKSNSSVDIRASKNENEKQEGIKTASNSGLLVNKRQK